MKEPKRKDLLRGYKRREPKRFIQYDGFRSMEIDSAAKADRDGHTIFARETYELMLGATVRVLIPPDAQVDDVLALLVEIRDWIVRDGLWKGKEAFDDEAFDDEALPF